LLGISKAKFVDLLDQHGIAYFRETPEELGAQVEALRELRDNPPSDDEDDAD
jgi:hypothetical protein